MIRSDMIPVSAMRGPDFAAHAEVLEAGRVLGASSGRVRRDQSSDIFASDFFGGYQTKPNN